MNKNKSIHEAIKFILASLEAQGQAPGTLKNYQNSFNVFEKYLNKHGISRVDEDVCLEYIYLKTILNTEKQRPKNTVLKRNMLPHGKP